MNELLLRRRLAAITPVLPYDAQVEYLQASGNTVSGGYRMRIDTGFVPKNTTRVVMEFKDFTTDGRWLFGARKALSDKAFGFYSDGSSTSAPTVQFDGGNIIYISSDYSLESNGKVTIDMNGATKKVTLSSELGSTITKSLNNGTFTAPVELVLFGMNNNGSMLSLSDYKLYSCKIYDNGTLVRDYIPVRVAQVGYLYDTVGSQLYGNAGTGSFLFGNDVTA